MKNIVTHVGLSVVAIGLLAKTADGQTTYTYTVDGMYNDVSSFAQGSATQSSPGSYWLIEAFHNVYSVLGEDISDSIFTSQITAVDSSWQDFLTVSPMTISRVMGVGGTDDGTAANTTNAVSALNTSPYNGYGSSSNQPYQTVPTSSAPIHEVGVYTFSEIQSDPVGPGYFATNAVTGELTYNLVVTTTNPFTPNSGGSPNTDYANSANWALGTVPNAVDASAVLSSVTSATTVNLPSTGVTVGRLGIDSASAYTLASSGSLTLSSSSGPAQVSISQGSHTISAPVVFGSDTTFLIAPTAQLTLSNSSGLAVNGINVAVDGGGILHPSLAVISNSGMLSLNGGTFSVGNIEVEDNSVVNLTGNLDGSGATASASNEFVGFGSSGSYIAVLNQNGGTNSARNVNVSDGGGVGSAGTYNLNSGILSASTAISVGTSGGTTGTFNQAGGSISTPTLLITRAGGVSATYVLSAGALATTTETVNYAGGNGTSGEFNQSGGSNTISGNLSIGPGATVYSTAGYTISGGTLSVGGVLTNDSQGVFEYDGGTVSANVDNFGTFNVRGGGTETLTGNFTNESGATLKTYGTTFAVTGTFTNNGTYSSDPATNRFGTLAVGQRGTLLGGVGDKFVVSNSLLSVSTDRAGWNTEQASLAFDGAGSHAFDVNGVDLGATWGGYQNNFAWGVVSLGANQSLSLINASGAGGAGLYVGQLELANGLSQLSELTTDGVNVYYDASLNPWLNDQTYSLTGGGTFSPVLGDGGTIALSLNAAVPEPASLLTVSALAGGLVARRRRWNGFH